MNRRGKVSPITLLLLAGIAVGIFYAINYGPAYLDNMDVKQIAQKYINRMENHDPVGDDRLKELCISELNAKVGSHDETDVFGNVKKDVHGLGLTPEQVIFERDTVNNTARIEITYTRTVKLWPFNKFKTLPFSVTKNVVAR